jgi:hypothetical protein
MVRKWSTGPISLSYTTPRRTNRRTHLVRRPSAIRLTSTFDGLIAGPVGVHGGGGGLRGGAGGVARVLRGAGEHAGQRGTVGGRHEAAAEPVRGPGRGTAMKKSRIVR